MDHRIGASAGVQETCARRHVNRVQELGPMEMRTADGFASDLPFFRALIIIHETGQGDWCIAVAQLGCPCDGSGCGRQCTQEALCRTLLGFKTRRSYASRIGFDWHGVRAWDLPEVPLVLSMHT
jgi:hypothetical protein